MFKFVRGQDSGAWGEPSTASISVPIVCLRWGLAPAAGDPAIRSAATCADIQKIGRKGSFVSAHFDGLQIHRDDRGRLLFTSGFRSLVGSEGRKSMTPWGVVPPARKSTNSSYARIIMASYPIETAMSIPAPTRMPLLDDTNLHVHDAAATNRRCKILWPWRGHSSKKSTSCEKNHHLGGGAWISHLICPPITRS